MRELENAVEYALAISNNETLCLEDLPPDIWQQNQSGRDLLNQCLVADAPLEELERQHILKMFERHGRRRTKTAAILALTAAHFSGS